MNDHQKSTSLDIQFLPRAIRSDTDCLMVMQTISLISQSTGFTSFCTSPIRPLATIHIDQLSVFPKRILYTISMGMEDMVDSLNTTFSEKYGTQEFTDWMVEGQPAGLYKNAGTFSYLRVYGAVSPSTAFKFRSCKIEIDNKNLPI